MIATEEPFMKLKLVAAISALAIPALAHAQQPKPDAANAVPLRLQAL